MPCSSSSPVWTGNHPRQWTGTREASPPASSASVAVSCCREWPAGWSFRRSSCPRPVGRSKSPGCNPWAKCCSPRIFYLPTRAKSAQKNATIISLCWYAFVFCNFFLTKTFTKRSGGTPYRQTERQLIQDVLGKHFRLQLCKWSIVGWPQVIEAVVVYAEGDQENRIPQVFDQIFVVKQRCQVIKHGSVEIRDLLVEAPTILGR